MAFWRKKDVKVSNLHETGVVGQLIQFDIDASEAGKAHPEVVINDGSTPCVVTALGSHLYRALFMPQEARQHVIQLKFNGQNLPKDPFKIDIRHDATVSRPRPQQITVSGPGSRGVPLNQPTSFNVCTGDRRRQVLARVTSPSGCQIEHYILDKDDGNYVVEYIPVEVGTYSIEVTCDGRVVSGKSFSVEAYNPVVVSTVSCFSVDKTTEFEIDTSLAGDGELEVTIVSRNDGSVPCAVTLLQRGLYLVTFTPMNSLPTYAQIYFNSKQLPQSPVRLDRQNSKQLNIPHPSAQTLPASGSRSQEVHPGYMTMYGSSQVHSVSSDDDVHDSENGPLSLRRDVTASAEAAGTSCYMDEEEIYAGISRHEDGTNHVSQDGSSIGGDSDSQDYIEPEDGPRGYKNVPEQPRDYENVPEDLQRVRENVSEDHPRDNESVSLSRRDESVQRADTPVSEDKVEVLKDLAQGHPGIREDVAQVLEALQDCLNGGVQEVYIVRLDLIADVFELYKDANIADKILSVEFLGEPGIDVDSLTRELFSSFWRQVAEDLFRGEDCLVPDVALFRVRKESWKFECLGRILSHTVALTGTIPSIFAKSTLVKFTTNPDVDDDCLLEDFLLFVTTREKTLLTKAMSDFSGLTEAESDRLQNFFMAHGFNNIPRRSEIKEQILTIAYQDLVEKPGSLIAKMHQGIPESHKAAFWQRLSPDDITHILQTQRPTPERVAGVIVPPKEDMTDDEDRTLYFLKEFVASLDFDTLTDFLIFVTGSVHQPDEINVTFTTLTGLDRRPVSHTCFNHLEVPTSYSSIKEFKREFLSVLASPEAFQYSEM